MRKNNLFFVCLMLGYVLMTLNACKTGEPNTKDASKDIFSEEYYIKNASNNLERLKMLLTGLFVQHNENLRDSSYYTWTVSGGTDSVLLYTIPVGTPSKDGHWLYVHQFMSSLPDAPVYSALQKFEQISRDTIKTVFYEPPNAIEFETLVTKGNSAFKDIDFSNLKPNGERVTYVRERGAKFMGASQIYENPRQNRNDYREDEYTVAPKRFYFRSQYYEDPKGKEFINKSTIISHLVRLDPDMNPLFEKRKK